MEYTNDEKVVVCKECETKLQMMWNYCPMCGKRVPWSLDLNPNTQQYAPVYMGHKNTKIYRRSEVLK